MGVVAETIESGKGAEGQIGRGTKTDDQVRMMTIWTRVEAGDVMRKGQISEGFEGWMTANGSS